MINPLPPHISTLSALETLLLAKNNIWEIAPELSKCQVSSQHITTHTKESTSPRSLAKCHHSSNTRIALGINELTIPISGKLEVEKKFFSTYL